MSVQWRIFGKYKWAESVVKLAETYEMKSYPSMSLLAILNKYYPEYRHMA